MLNINRKLSHKGFSLIELMVAAAILAFIVFGIFQAYSTGFMGMADARDRTVATNYAREAMEDVKNMEFEKITTTTKSVITSTIKYRVDVNVSSESESVNLKKILTIVSWQDRNGIVKTVDTTMFVNHTEIYASAAARIVLYAESYSILNESSIEGATSTKLTAVIKDIKGNTVIDWAGDEVSFLIKSGAEFGDLSGITSTINGIAEETFTSSGDVPEGDIGYAVIEASVNLPDIGNVSDSVTIKITDGPVKIILSDPIPDIIKASTDNSSTITVSLCDAENIPLPKLDLGTDVVIDFEVFVEGTLSSYTIIMYDTDVGLASEEIILSSTGIPGLVSVSATADDLESDIVDVRFLGPPDSISISANPNPIYVDDIEGSTVTVSLLDVNGFPTNPAVGDIPLIIDLTLETGDGVGGGLGGGDLVGDSFSFPPSDSEGVTRTTTFFGQLDTGEAEISANGGGLLENSVIINILSSLVPDHIELSAFPENVKVKPCEVEGEECISTIEAIVYDMNGRIVTNYNEKISFVTTWGTFSDGSTYIDVTPPFNGVATAKLSSTDPGYATVTASSLGLTDVTVTVGFYTDPSYIGLAFNPPDMSVKADGVETITIIATIYDGNNIIVTGYNEIISFGTTMGTFSGGSTYIEVTPVNGVATAKLSSSTYGDATVTVSSVGLADVDKILEFYEEITLTLIEEEPIQYDSTNKMVTFYVNVAGDKINVDEMKVIWDNSSPSERLSKIVVDDEELYNGSAKSGAIVDIIDEGYYLSIGDHTIELTFLQDMAERQIDVMFYPPVTGWYLIRFDVP